MNTTLRCLLVAASAATLTASASAQLLNSATNAATNVRTVVPPTPPPPPPPPSVTATTAAQSAATTAATVRAPVLPPTQAATATAGAVGANVSTSHQPAVVGSANASATGQLHGAAGLNVAATHGINATVNTAETTAAIQQTAFAARDTLSSQIEAKIDASAQVLADAKVRAEATGDQARAEFARALRDVRAKEKELRSSLRAAVKEKKETAWGEVQSELAKDYSAYATAVVAAEAAANGNASAGETPAPSEAPKS